MQAKKIFESPDGIKINGRTIHYNSKKYAQRSFVIFRSGEVWISSVGEDHEALYAGEGISAPPPTALTGRVWPGLKVISFWHNPVYKFKGDYEKYMDLLEKELSRYKINLRNMRFDLYGIWETKYKFTLDPKLEKKYNESTNTLTDDYDTFMLRLKKTVSTLKAIERKKIKAEKAAEAKSKEENPNANREYSPSGHGSSKTSWDSTNNIRYRQARQTSESFYPTLKR